MREKMRKEGSGKLERKEVKSQRGRKEERE